ncbi:MAG: hypothetical protein QM758_07480 [Armatimonas sp.]
MNTPEILRDIAAWDAATSTERRIAAEAVFARLPETWKLTELATFALGDQAHEIAAFEFDGATFHLIPGAPSAVLGYDRDNPWIPPAQFETDLDEMRREFFDCMDGYDENLAPLRTVAITPCLVEIAPTEATWQDELEEGKEEFPTLSDGAESYRRDGFRLPTSDEWEYLCRAGTRTLWRWGNEIPLEDSYRSKTDIHQRPNAFGLTFCTSTYDSELCDDGELPGTDGGSSVCGGYGIVASWMPLACAFRQNREEAEDLIMEFADGMKVRRLLPLIEQD